MDKDSFKELASRLEEIGKVLNKLPPEVRETAFELLRAYAVGSDDEQEVHAPGEKKGQVAKKDHGGNSLEDLIDRFDHDKPHEAVKLIVAHLYGEYGTDPFSTEDIRGTADELGVTVPARPDATIRAAQHQKKKLFKGAGKGLYKPTVHGEKYLKDTYGVTKGTKKRVRGDNE